MWYHAQACMHIKFIIIVIYKFVVYIHRGIFLLDTFSFVHTYSLCTVLTVFAAVYHHKAFNFGSIIANA